MKAKYNKSTRQLLLNNLVIAVIICFLIFLLLAGVREYFKKSELEQEVLSLQQELEQLNLDKQDFLESIENYQSEFFIEQEAREKFNMKRQGEEIVFIPLDNYENSYSASLKQVEEPIEQDFFIVRNVKSWWHYFFGDEKYL